MKKKCGDPPLGSRQQAPPRPCLSAINYAARGSKHRVQWSGGVRQAMIFHGDNPTLVTREPALATTPASELLNGSSEWAGSSEEADSGGQVQGAAPFLIELVAVYTTGNTTEEPGYRWPGPGPLPAASSDPGLAMVLSLRMELRPCLRTIS